MSVRPLSPGVSMRTNTPSLSASQWLINALARPASDDSACRDHRADRKAASEAAKQREADQFAVAVEPDAVRVRQQRGQHLGAVEPAGARRQFDEPRRVVRTERPQPFAGGSAISGGWNAAP